MYASTHSEAIDVLTELYTLLATLLAVPLGAFWLPNPNSNSHTYESDTGEESILNTNAALAVGFSTEAVRFLASIPYWDHPIYIQPNTRTKSYLGLDGIGCTATESSSICGADFIYDVEKKLVYRWPADSSDPHSGDDDNNGGSKCPPDHFHHKLPSSSPRDALQSIIAKFRGLHYINKPPWDGSDHELLISESEPEFTTSDDPNDLQREALYRRLRDMHLECGWNVDAVQQTAFRRTEFLEKRRDYLNDLFGARADFFGELDQN